MMIERYSEGAITVDGNIQHPRFRGRGRRRGFPPDVLRDMDENQNQTAVGVSA